jgi:protein-disulfide isomerase
MDTTRRALLAGVGGAGLAGLSGCLGGVLGSGGAGGGECGSLEEPTVSELPPPVAGDPEAGVTVAVFEDFACPHCATFSLEVVPELRERLLDPGRVRYEHRDFPLPVDERWSWAVASAARGVQDAVGDEAFFSFATACFENQRDYSLSLLGELGVEAGVDDGCAVRTDAANESYRPVVEADRRRAREAGAGGTPAVFVNGRSVRGTADAIVSAVEAAE